MKTCGTCKQDKPLEDFNRKSASPDGHQGTCRDCNRVALKDHYEANIDYYLEKARRAADRLKQKYIEFKTGKPCFDCGEMFPHYVLEFDHRGDEPKQFNIANMIPAKGWAAILTEIAKCDLVCANCHKIRTYVRRNYSGVGELADPPSFGLGHFAGSKPASGS